MVYPMIQYMTEIWDESGELRLMGFLAEDTFHARDQASESLDSGERVGLVMELSEWREDFDARYGEH